MTENKSEYVFILPCYVAVGEKKISLTMNWYRNAHFQILNKVKQFYSPLSFERFTAENIAVSYCLIWNSARRTDLMNWIAVADKFFMDWLVVNGFLKDDNVAVYGDMSASCTVDKTKPKSFIQATVKTIK